MKESTLKKHRLLVDQWFINGFNGTNAYIKFYPNVSENTASVEFNRILKNPNILEYQESKMQKATAELNLTFTEQINRLEFVYETAEKPADKINALKEINKLLGYYNTHNGQKKPETINNELTREEIIRISQELEDKY